jgi:hypothetical protein
MGDKRIFGRPDKEEGQAMRTTKWEPPRPHQGINDDPKPISIGQIIWTVAMGAVLFALIYFMLFPAFRYVPYPIKEITPLSTTGPTN